MRMWALVPLPRGTPRGLIEACGSGPSISGYRSLPRGTPRGLIEALHDEAMFLNPVPGFRGVRPAASLKRVAWTSLWRFHGRFRGVRPAASLKLRGHRLDVDTLLGASAGYAPRPH